MLIIGLTGGIGTGKSTVTKRFIELGVPVIDADEIAHELVKSHQPALQAIISEFGTEFLTAEGELNRSLLRQVVFDDPQRRKILESILHPLIRKEMLRRAGLISAPYCIFCIPLLAETRQTDMVDRVLVVDSPEKLQYERVKKRAGLSETEIKAILAAQAKREDRLAVADDVIVNEGSLDDVYRQVDRLHEKYLGLDPKKTAGVYLP